MGSIKIYSDFNVYINFLLAVEAVYTNHYCKESKFPNLHLNDYAFLDVDSFRDLLQRYWVLMLTKLKESGTTRELDPEYLFSNQPILRDLFASNSIGLDTFMYFRDFYKDWFSCCRVAFDLSISELIGSAYHKLTENIAKNDRFDCCYYMITYREVPELLANKLENVHVMSFDHLVMKGISPM